MSDSGRQINDCPHGQTKGWCITCLRSLIQEIHNQHGDDLCWMDIDKIFQAIGLPIPDRRVGNKEAMKLNCDRFVDTMCEEGGDWKSYVELEKENESLKNENSILKEDGIIAEKYVAELEGDVNRLVDMKNKLEEEIKQLTKQMMESSGPVISPSDN